MIGYDEGAEFDRPVETGDGLALFAQPMQHQAQAIERGHALRGQGEGSVVELHRLVEPAHLGQHVSQVGQGGAPRSQHRPDQPG